MLLCFYIIFPSYRWVFLLSLVNINYYLNSEKDYNHYFPHNNFPLVHTQRRLEKVFALQLSFVILLCFIFMLQNKKANPIARADFFILFNFTLFDYLAI